MIKQQNAIPDVVHRLESPCGQMTVEYRWANDRFIHRVLLDGQVCFSSVDGDGSQAWPASPPIQQISLEPIQDVPMILGVGGAGTGHWSISVGWKADEGGTGGAFCFDIACRTKDAPAFLGSTYQTESDRGDALKFDAQIGKKTQKGQETMISAALDQTSQTFRWVYSLRV